MLQTFIIVSAVLLLIILLIVTTREKYIMTLGDYGKPNPKSCDEITPRGGVCSACNLECGIYKYKQNCIECQSHMS
jgi:hypothetical protein